MHFGKVPDSVYRGEEPSRFGCTVYNPPSDAIRADVIPIKATRDQSNWGKCA